MRVSGGNAHLSLGSAASIVSEAAERHAVLVGCWKAQAMGCMSERIRMRGSSSLLASAAGLTNDVVQESLSALQGQALHGLARLTRVLHASKQKQMQQRESISGMHALHELQSSER